jgi:hypothetical protein
VKIEFELVAKFTPKCFRALEFAVYLNYGPDARLDFPMTGVRPQLFRRANLSVLPFSPLHDNKTRRGNAADAKRAHLTNIATKTNFRMKYEKKLINVF